MHKIISYVEIIAEEQLKSDSLQSAAELPTLLSTCEAALLAIKRLKANKFVELPEGQDVPEVFSGHARQLMALSTELAVSSVLKPFSDSLTADLNKIEMAASEFETVVSQMGPRLELLSALNQEGRSSEPADASSAPSKQETSRSYRGVILIVDDEEANRDVLSRRLLRDNYEVMLAESGRQALRMLRRYRFDLLLLDIMMPEMNGFEVLEAVRADERLSEILIVMTSALDEVDNIAYCLEHGADDYLSKPFNPVLLRARIGALLERKALQDEQRQRRKELQSMLVEVESQKNKTEELLLNVLPKPVADELLKHGEVKPMYFDDVSIVFADIVGFCSATEDLSADELVHALNQHFTALDRITQKYGLEKLKTVGDSYMFAGGLPSRTPSHPVDSVLAALDMIWQSRQSMLRNGTVWDLRVGVHTGPVIAGVVGIHKFAFDVWGETVNFSSRVEAGGTPGRVNISHSAYLRVKDFFNCERRDHVQTKGGKQIDIYTVGGLASSLTSDDSISPGEAFAARYRKYFRQEVVSIPSGLLKVAKGEPHLI